MRSIDVQLHRLVERLVVHIDDDANDRLPRSVNTPTYALSDGILARPELSRCGLAYDGDRLRIKVVCKGKRAAFKQRNAERLKIIPYLPRLPNPLYRLTPALSPTFAL